MTALIIEATVTDANGHTGTGSVTVDVVMPELPLMEEREAPVLEAEVSRKLVLPDFAERARQRWNQVR